MAVDDIASAAPATTASGQRVRPRSPGRPSRSAAISARLPSSCTLPQPKIGRRMDHSRLGSSSRPIRNSISTTPNSARSTICDGSVTSRRPHGPIAKPARQVADDRAQPEAARQRHDDHGRGEVGEGEGEPVAVGHRRSVVGRDAALVGGDVGLRRRRRPRAPRPRAPAGAARTRARGRAPRAPRPCARRGRPAGRGSACPPVRPSAGRRAGSCSNGWRLLPTSWYEVSLPPVETTSHRHLPASARPPGP